MQASDISLAAATSLSTLENGVRNLEAVGFEVMAVSVQVDLICAICLCRFCDMSVDAYRPALI